VISNQKRKYKNKRNFYINVYLKDGLGMRMHKIMIAVAMAHASADSLAKAS